MFCRAEQFLFSVPAPLFRVTDFQNLLVQLNTMIEVLAGALL
jgi:hypothetical protein